MRAIIVGSVIATLHFAHPANAQQNAKAIQQLKNIEERRRIASLHGDTLASLQFTSLTFDSVDVRVFNNTGIVTGITRRSGTYKGKPFDQPAIRYSRVYVFEKGQWRVVFGQNTTINRPQPDSTRGLPF